MKKDGRTTLVHKLDILWSKVVRKYGKCEVCDGIGHLNAHHIISRSNYKLRWDLQNGACLCSGHHSLCNLSAHKNPAWFMDIWLESKRPQDKRYLIEMCQVSGPVKTYELEEKYNRLKELE